MNTIKVENVVEHEDGTATLEFAIDCEKTRANILGEGLRYLILKGMFELSDHEVFTALQGYVDARD